MLTMDLDYARMRIGRIRRHLGRMLFGSSLSLLFHILLFVSLVALSWEWFFPPQDNQRQEILMAEIAYGSVAGNPHTTSKTKRQPAAPSKPKKTSSKMDKLAKEDTLKKPTPGFTSAPQQASPKEEVAEISKPIQLATAPQSPIGRGVHSGRLKQPPPQDDSYEELLRLWFAEHQPLQLTLPEQGKRQVVMRVRIAPGGAIIEAQVANSSGVQEIDQIAVEMIKAANPVPEMPHSYAADGDQEFLIPFLF